MSDGFVYNGADCNRNEKEKQSMSKLTLHTTVRIATANKQICGCLHGFCVQDFSSRGENYLT